MPQVLDWDIFLRQYASRCIFGRLDVLQQGYQFTGSIKLVELLEHGAISIYINNAYQRKQFTQDWYDIGCARIIFQKIRPIKDIGPDMDTLQERFYVVLPDMGHAIIYTRDHKRLNDT